MPSPLQGALLQASVAKTETVQQSLAPPTGEVTLAMRKAGWLAATIGAYVKASQQPIAIGQSKESHLRYFQKEWAFFGTPQADGSIVIEGSRFLWDGKALKEIK